MYLHNAAAQRGILLHLADVVEQKEQLAVRGARDHGQRLAFLRDSVEAGIEDFLLFAHGHLVGVGLPALAIRRIGQHEIEGARGVLVGGERGAEGDVRRLLAVALEHHVRLGDGVGLGVDLLAEQMDGHLFTGLRGDGVQAVLCHREHSTRSTGSVIARVRGVLDLVGNGLKYQVRHQLHDVAGRPVLAGFFVVGLVESPHQFFKEGTHGMIIQTGQIAARLGAEIDILADKLLNHRTKNIGVDHGCDLVAELELVQNLLNVGRKAVEIRFKIRLELLACRAAGQIAQTEGRSVAKSLTGGVAQCAPLVCDARVVQHFLHTQHLLLGALQHGVQAADDRHGQNDIAVLAAHIHIPKAIIGDAPDEVGNCIE